MYNSHHSIVLTLSFAASFGYGETATGTSRWGNESRNDQLVYSCPPWFIPSKQADGSVHCACGDLTNGHLRCNDKDQTYLEASIQLSKCMTFDESKGDTYEFNCVLLRIENSSNLYSALPQNVSELNEFTCGTSYRQGLLCGSCIEGYAPSLYNYELECIECTHNAPTRWILFFVVTFVPVTILFIVVILAAPINLMSPTFNMFIVFSQLVTLPGNLWGMIQVLTQFPGVNTVRLLDAIKIFFSIYGIWNLDFFRPYIRICLSENMGHIVAYFLEYLVAFYVIILIAAMFILIELHDRNFKLVVWVIRPFRYCFKKFTFTKKLDIRTSTIHTFATFVTLFYVKIGTVSIHAFQNAHLINRTGDTVSPVYFFFDTTVQYLTGPHLVLAILAIILFVIIIVPLPLLLFTYQFRYFRRCIDCLPISFQEGLRVYMDSFQGYYHDGTSGDKDYRYFSGVYFLIRLLTFTLQMLSFQFSLLVMTVVCVITALLYTSVRPYKTNTYNITDGILLVNLGFLYMSMLLLGLFDLLGLSVSIMQVIIPLLLITPLIYLILLGSCKLLKPLCHKWKLNKRGWSGSILDNNSEIIEEIDQNRDQTTQSLVSNSLPDRIINLDTYNMVV